MLLAEHMRGKTLCLWEKKKSSTLKWNCAYWAQSLAGIKWFSFKELQWFTVPRICPTVAFCVCVFFFLGLFFFSTVLWFIGSCLKSDIMATKIYGILDKHLIQNEQYSYKSNLNSCKFRIAYPWYCCRVLNSCC